jgi:hypothetical protein
MSLPTWQLRDLQGDSGLTAININYLGELDYKPAGLPLRDYRLSLGAHSHSETKNMGEAATFPVEVHNWALPSLIILTQIEIVDYFSIIFNYL